MMRFAPDDPEAMQIYAECERLGLPVIFHAGRSGIEPESIRPYALIRHYVPAIAAYPRRAQRWTHSAKAVPPPPWIRTTPGKVAPAGAMPRVAGEA